MTCRNVLKQPHVKNVVNDSERVYQRARCFGFGSSWTVPETHSGRLKVPFMFWVSRSYRNDFAFVGLSDHSCRFPNLQTEYKAERKVK